MKYDALDLAMTVAGLPAIMQRKYQQKYTIAESVNKLTNVAMDFIDETKGIKWEEVTMGSVTYDAKSQWYNKFSPVCNDWLEAVEDYGMFRLEQEMLITEFYDMSGRQCHFYLFGTIACKAYDDPIGWMDEIYGDDPQADDIRLKVVAKTVKNGDGQIFGYTEDWNRPVDLLQEYDGWMNYRVLTKDEYFQLLELGS